MKIRWMLSVAIAVIVIIIGFVSFAEDSSSTHQGLTGGNHPIEKGIEIVYTEEMSKVISDIYTTDKVLSLTFNGMADLSTMKELLQKLDEHRIRATFFLPGIRVAEEPDIAEMIVEAGHEIQNNTLGDYNLDGMTYEQIYENLKLSQDIFMRETGSFAQYVRTRSGDVHDLLRQAAFALGMKAVAGYTINPRDSDMKSAREIGEYVDRFLHRGAIVQLNTHMNPEVIPAIDHIASVAGQKGYQFLTLSELIESSDVRKPLEAIPGYDAVTMNLDFQSVPYTMFERLPNGEGYISLTFDDWGSEGTINHILDILRRYNVKSTFFVNGIGVENNPNLARAIVEEGHEIANHTYSHKAVTNMTTQEIQEEIIRAHRVITEAIQQQPVMMFRPPTGVINDRLARIVAATGYTTIALYDVTTLDWNVNNSAEHILNTILERTEDGSIILLHLHDSIHTSEALPHIIEQLLARGHKFVKLTELVDIYQTREVEQLEQEHEGENEPEPDHEYSQRSENEYGQEYEYRQESYDQQPQAGSIFGPELEQRQEGQPGRDLVDKS